MITEKPKYASGTKVSSSKSEIEIRNTLKKFGANKYAYYEDDENIGISFEYESRRVRLVVKLPDPEAKEFVYFETRLGRRSQSQQLKLWQNECNRRWRALTLKVKSRLSTLR